MTNTSQDDSEHLLFKDIPWMLVYICEAFLILVGNLFTIYIFWSIRKQLKRASYLLINLAVADFFVGIGVVLCIGADIAVLLGKQISLMLVDAIITVDVTATVASLSSLVLISLERMVIYSHQGYPQTKPQGCYKIWERPALRLTFPWQLTGARVETRKCGFSSQNSETG